MALTGELSDLSLAELIEFFCNQRKTGCLEVTYGMGPAHFYLQSGSVVHAEVGMLRGIEAVYYALTLPNASFKFSGGSDEPKQTINQPWTSVVLEGLRRMDEGIAPPNPFPEKSSPTIVKDELATPVVEAIPAEPVRVVEVKPEIAPAKHDKFSPNSVTAPASEPKIPSLRIDSTPTPAFLVEADAAGNFAYGPWRLSAIFGAVILIVAVIAVPWGWYARSKAAKLNEENKPVSATAQPAIPSPPATQTQTLESSTSPKVTETPAASEEVGAREIAKSQREPRVREEARLKAAASQMPRTVSSTQSSSPIATAPAAKSETPLASASRKVTVQVTYDENGRVTQASGGDATALRIARQKRFPTGKAGSATITIPIN